MPPQQVAANCRPRGLPAGRRCSLATAHVPLAGLRCTLVLPSFPQVRRPRCHAPGGWRRMHAHGSHSLWSQGFWAAAPPKPAQLHLLAPLLLRRPLLPCSRRGPRTCGAWPQARTPPVEEPRRRDHAPSLPFPCFDLLIAFSRPLPSPWLMPPCLPFSHYYLPPLAHAAHPPLSTSLLPSGARLHLSPPPPHPGAFQNSPHCAPHLSAPCKSSRGRPRR